MRTATATHHTLQIGEIDTYKGGLHGDKLGDTLRCRCQDIVSLTEGLAYGQLAIHLTDALVVDYEQRVGILAQLLHSACSLLATCSTLPQQGKCNVGNSQKAHLVCQLGDDGRSTCTCTATHTCGNEDHLGLASLEVITNLVNRLHSQLATAVGVVTCSQTGAHNDFILGGNVEVVQRALIGITSKEVYILDTHTPHIVERITSGTAHTDNGYNR